MEYFLALDQGSTSSKASLISSGGTVTHVASLPIQTFRRHSSWVEHRPEEILKTQMQAARLVVKRVHPKGGKVVAVGLAGQRATLLVWDKATGKPLVPALSWQDLRTVREEGRFLEYQDLIHQKTGLRLTSYYAALKLRWILLNVRGARTKAEAGKLLCGSVNTFMIWNFTRGEYHVIDPTQASRTLLMNLDAFDHKYP